ncbi:MAG: hypothetical protein ABSA30_01655 [Candidatus Aminicenantales bacterium]|jgi:hypothetical protein
MKSAGFKTLAAAAVLSLSAPCAAQVSNPGGEIALTLGAGFTMAQGGVLQRQAWTDGPLAGTAIENALAISHRSALFLGASYTNFFSGVLGVQAGFGYLNSPLETRADFSPGRPGVPSRRLTADPDPSEVASVPLFVALALRWRGERAGIVLTAGPAVILHSLLAETRAGTLLPVGAAPAAYGVTASLPDQSWTAFGGILGAALDLKIGPRTTLTFDARYVLSPARKFAWSFSAGTAVGLDDPASRAAFDAAAASAAAAGAPAITINPSFFQLSMGIKLRLGPL